LASAGAALYLVFTNLRSVISLGAELSHLSDQTGIAAGQLLILQTAFKDAGVDGAQVGKVVNKMQKAIVDATGPAPLLTYVRAFERIGLKAEDLKKMKPADQFKEISKALRNTKDQATRTASAMELFGKAGPQAMAVIMDENAIDDAAKALGTMPDDMDRLADTLERVDTLIGRFKMKMQQAFLPIVEKFLPKILAWLEKMNAQDFGVWGKKIAQGLGTVFNIIKSGNGPELFANVLLLGLLKFVKLAIPVWSAFTTMIASAMIAAMTPIAVMMAKLNPANVGKTDDELSEEIMNKAMDDYAKGAKMRDKLMDQGLTKAEWAPKLRIAALWMRFLDKGEDEIKMEKDKVDKKPWLADEDVEEKKDLFSNFRASVGDSLSAIGGGGGVFGGTSGFWSIVEQQKQAAADRAKARRNQEAHLKELKEIKEKIGGDAPEVVANAA